MFSWNLLYIVPVALIAIMVHEVSHGLVSTWLGDPTPKAQGRLSFNIFKHIDVFGTLSLIFFGFGWAKPVEIDPRYYKNIKTGTALVAIAGPISNFLLAFISAFVYLLIFKILGWDLSGFALIVSNFFYYLTIINLGLGIFNLFPFPPLDGSKVLAVVLPDQWYRKLMYYERIGMFLLVILIVLNVLDRPLNWLITNTLELLYNLVAFILNIN
ncbi:MAG TPA: site-2 protease family protein [Bacilli bacterium]|nr:MAG: Peptidase family M50 [Tenericutes bacterium ADurb.BinA124]HOH18651.1 site-2 protease family protein [Bacilli bacterium]HPX84888.1 site-2 protease family protein [Bacilli bacterium]HQC74567.1 site-2 protease family protein [Bacilli bacterium]